MAAPSAKRQQIDKISKTMVMTLSIASFLVVFSAVACRSLLSQRAYQAKVISKKENARDQLIKNLDASNTLINAYKTFTSTSQNAIGGDPNGTGPKDGDNAKIILDALPSSYDFPGLANSLDKLLSDNNVKINSLSGSDEQVAQQTNVSSATPVAVPIPFQVGVTGNYRAIENLISVFEASIRPIKANIVKLSGNDKTLTLDFAGQTFYQPSRALQNTTEVVK